MELAQRAKEIYMSEKRTIEEKRILINLIFSNLTLNNGTLAVSFTQAYSILMTT